MSEHSDHTTAALLAGARASAAMPHPVEYPTQAMEDRRLARLWKTAGVIAFIEGDIGPFGELLEACGLLPYEPAKPPKARPEHGPPIKHPVAGQ